MYFPKFSTWSFLLLLQIIVVFNNHVVVDGSALNSDGLSQDEIQQDDDKEQDEPLLNNHIYQYENHELITSDSYNDDEVGDEENSREEILRATVSTNPEDVTFYLFYDKTKPKMSDQIFIGKPNSITSAHFVVGKPVIFITHGFLSMVEGDETPCAYLKNAYLKMNFVNIICVDWSPLSTADSSLAFFTYYSVVENGVPICGKQISKMIRFLIKMGIITGPEMVHLLGHSLGSHCSGIAGYETNKKTGKMVDRISGLDPAGPLYKFIKPEMKLTPDDASFVDALHTDIGQLGSSEILGDADFYANGGKGFAQPNCINFTLSALGSLFGNALGGLCSHSRSYHYYSRSILRTQPELYGCKCMTSDNSVLPVTCYSPMNMCEDKTLYGEYVPRSAKGTYYVDVGAVLPGLGEVPLIGG